MSLIIRTCLVSPKVSIIDRFHCTNIFGAMEKRLNDVNQCQFYNHNSITNFQNQNSILKDTSITLSRFQTLAMIDLTIMCLTKYSVTSTITQVLSTVHLHNT